MSYPVRTEWKLSSLKMLLFRRNRSFTGPKAWAISSCRQSRISCGASSLGRKTAICRRAARFGQSVSGSLRRARKSAQPETLGRTMQAAVGAMRWSSASGTVSTMIEGVWPGFARRMSILASRRNRSSKRSRSRSRVAGCLPRTATVTGPSNRLNTFKGRPLSN